MVSAASVLQTEAAHEVPANRQVRDSCATVITDPRARAFDRLSTRRERPSSSSRSRGRYAGPASPGQEGEVLDGEECRIVIAPGNVLQV
jgi:hypothetical protein